MPEPVRAVMELFAKRISPARTGGEHNEDDSRIECDLRNLAGVLPELMGRNMTEYKISSPDAELLGGMIYSLWTAFPESFQEMLKKILAKHGLEDVVPDNWYRVQPVLDALKEIEESFGHYLLREVGQQAAERAPIPPEITSLQAVLFSLNPTLHKFHRGGNIGGYEVTEQKTDQGLTRYQVVASTPYPCSLTGGYLEGYSKRYGPADWKEVLVRHDDASPCRRHGAETCTYIVTCW